jgi:hypothetical protein
LAKSLFWVFPFWWRIRLGGFHLAVPVFALR